MAGFIVSAMEAGGLALVDRAHLAIVAAKVRPGWLRTGVKDGEETPRSLICAAKKAGLKHLPFAGLDELTVLGERRFSGCLFYHPEAVDPADIAHLERHGWGRPEDSPLVGRVLGYDHPGCLDGKGVVGLVLTTAERRRGHPVPEMITASLFWYKVPELDGDSTLRAAQMAVAAQKAIKADMSYREFAPIVMVVFKEVAAPGDRELPEGPG